MRYLVVDKLREKLDAINLRLSYLVVDTETSSEETGFVVADCGDDSTRAHKVRDALEDYDGTTSGA